MDLILGRFVDSCVADLRDEQLSDLEALLEWPDADLFGWIMGQVEVPPDADSPMLKRIVAFHFGRDERT